jgi:Omp85 superfamily domain
MLTAAHARIGRTLACGATIALALSSVPPWAYAITDPTQADGQTQVEAEEGVKTGHDFVIAPIPISNPSIGTGLALTGMVLYKLDQDSPESSTALGAGYLSSGSWLVGVGQKLNFDADRYRLIAALGLGQVNYTFFGVGADSTSSGVPIEQKVAGGMLDFRRQIVEGLHIGLRYSYGTVKTSLQAPPAELAPILEGKELDLTIAGLGPVASWDTRDRQFSPTKGTFAEFKSNFANSAFGSDLAYQTYSLAWNAYYSLGAPNVLAARVYLCKASESAPFFATCAYGTGSDLRGYEAGRYRDLNLIAAQAEYRLRLASRFGAVVFAGTGSVAGSFGDLFSSTSLPSAGIGLRYLAVPSQGVNISIDYAWGKSGSSGLYVYIGDSF